MCAATQQVARDGRVNYQRTYEKPPQLNICGILHNPYGSFLDPLTTRCYGRINGGLLADPKPVRWRRTAIAYDGTIMRLSLIPRNYRFFDLFEESARKLVAGADMLVDLLDHFENVDMKTARIKDLEHEADDITHEVYKQVYQTFLTPLDREDIVALAQKLDDVLDFIT